MKAPTIVDLNKLIDQAAAMSFEMSNLRGKIDCNIASITQKARYKELAEASNVVQSMIMTPQAVV